MIHEFPYANLHDQNYDWILKVVRTFQEQYSSIPEAIANALEQIENAKNGSLAEMQSALTNAIETIALHTADSMGRIDAYTENAVHEVHDVKESAISDINTAKNAVLSDITVRGDSTIASIGEAKADAIDSIDSSLTQALSALQSDFQTFSTQLSSAADDSITRVSNIFNTFPIDYNEMQYRVQALDTVVMEWPTYLYFMGGYYQVNNYNPPVFTSDDYMLSCALMAGVAGQTVIIQTRAPIKIKRITYFTQEQVSLRWTQRYAAPQTSRYAKFTFPRDFTNSMSIELEKDDGSAVTAQDVTTDNLTLSWYHQLMLPIGLGYEEPTLVASRDYYNNSFFLQESILYKVPLELAEGGTISRYIKTNAADEITELIYYEKYNTILSHSGVLNITSDMIEQGSWGYGVKAPNTSSDYNTRIRVKHLIPVSAGDVVEFTNNGLDVFFGVVNFPGENSYPTPLIGWQTGASGVRTISINGFMTIVLRKNGAIGDNITPADFNNVISIKSKIYNELHPSA